MRVGVFVLVLVAVNVREGVNVLDGVKVLEGVNVLDGVNVLEGVKVFEGVRVFDGVKVIVGVSVLVGVLVIVGVRDGVRVEDGVRVTVGLPFVAVLVNVADTAGLDVALGRLMLLGVLGVVVFLRATPAISRPLVGKAPGTGVSVFVAGWVRSMTPDTGPAGVAGRKTTTVGGAEEVLNAADILQNSAPPAMVINAIPTIATALSTLFKPAPRNHLITALTAQAAREAFDYARRSAQDAGRLSS